MLGSLQMMENKIPSELANTRGAQGRSSPSNPPASPPFYLLFTFCIFLQKSFTYIKGVNCSEGTTNTQTDKLTYYNEYSN